jgi:hypothetical protein
MTTRRTRRAQTILLITAVALCATSVSVAAVRGTRGGPATPEGVLLEARRYVTEHETVRFEGDTRSESTFGGFFSGEQEDVPDDQATTVVSRAVVEGVSAGPDRSRTVTRMNGAAIEALVVGDKAWSRMAEPDEELADRKWTEVDLTPNGFGEEPGGFFFEDPGGAMLSMSADLRELGSLTGLIDRAVAPTIVSRAGGLTVVHAALDFSQGRSDMFELDKGTVELTLAEEGRPVRSVVEANLALRDEGLFGGTGMSFDMQTRTEQEYSGWGEPVDIEEPSEDEIDLTPNLEEEAIAQYQDVPLYQPRGIPEGWELDYADVIPSDTGDTGCDQVSLDYIDPGDETFGYLYLYETSPDCTDVTAPEESQPFVAGPNRGWVENVDGEYTYAQIVVGGTVIEADTDLSVDALRRVLSQLRALDLGVTPDPIAGLTTESGTLS